MLAVATEILAILAVLAPIAVILARWWWTRRPSVKAKRRRKENEEIANRVRDGDAGYVNRRVQEDIDQQ